MRKAEPRELLLPDAVSQVPNSRCENPTATQSQIGSDRVDFMMEVRTLTIRVDVFLLRSERRRYFLDERTAQEPLRSTRLLPR